MFQKHVNFVAPFVALLHKPNPRIRHPELVQVLSDISYPGLSAIAWSSDSLIISDDRAKQQLFGQSAIIHSGHMPKPAQTPEPGNVADCSAVNIDELYAMLFMWLILMLKALLATGHCAHFSSGAGH